MVSKNEIRLITNLSQKKYRKKHQLFVAEGVKIVEELFDSGFEIYKIYILEAYSGKLPLHLCTIINKSELQKLSKLHAANTILAVFKIPDTVVATHTGLQLVLDGIKDPGNLGTIIRLCDWFGISQLICSLDTVDCYNPKVVQATMGSLARINIAYVDIETFLKESQRPIYVSLLEGKNMYKEKLPKEAILIMGNEANGVQESIKNLATHKLTIPRFNEQVKTESLNVAMATAVLLSEFRR